MAKGHWTREEFMLVMNLYTKIRYGQFHAKNPEVINLAKLINKTPGAVAYKLVHLSGLDPFHRNRGIRGLANPGKNAVAIYNEFQANWNERLYESEVLLAKYQNSSVEKKYFSENEYKELSNEVLRGKKGIDKNRFVKTRVNQSLFRQIILNNYDSTCAICGINLPKLVIASHILKWSENKEERLNPENGICFCSIHDKAFEVGYLGITSDYKIVTSKKLDDMVNKETLNVIFTRHNDKKLLLPDKYYPNKNFLELHLSERFIH